MNIYTSRFSNPELSSGKYTAVRICVGAPRWTLPYPVAGAIDSLKPFGLFGNYDDDKEGFRRKYFKLLNKAGVDAIRRQLNDFAAQGKDVVLLCYEDVRKGDDDWCHRVMFAEWWHEKTGEVINELPDPSTPKIAKPKKAVGQTVTAPPKAAEEEQLQLSLF